MLFPAIFAMSVGALMIAQWAVTLVRSPVAGPDQDPISGRGTTEMAFHWVAEGATAAALITAGFGLLLGWNGAPKLYLVSIGALIYTVINSPGFFAQRKQWAMVTLFAVLLTLSAVSIPFVW
jgi:hypothetical protein